jgi:hypothetical protein
VFNSEKKSNLPPKTICFWEPYIENSITVFIRYLPYRLLYPYNYSFSCIRILYGWSLTIQPPSLSLATHDPTVPDPTTRLQTNRLMSTNRLQLRSSHSMLVVHSCSCNSGSPRWCTSARISQSFWSDVRRIWGAILGWLRNWGRRLRGEEVRNVAFFFFVLFGPVCWLFSCFSLLLCCPTFFILAAAEISTLIPLARPTAYRLDSIDYDYRPSANQPPPPPPIQ